MIKKYTPLILLIILFQCVGAGMGVLTSQGMGWYATIVKSPLTPPSWAFPVAWTSLYALMGIAAWRVMLLRDSTIIALFALLALLNWSWSPLFFTAHMTGTAFVSIMAQNCLTLALIIRAYHHDRVISLALFPLLCWTGFASYLNYFIWVNN